MAKKNSLKREKDKKGKRGKANGLFYIVGAVFVLLAGFIGLRSFGQVGGQPLIMDPDTRAYIERVQKAGLDETNPLMPSSRYSSRVAWYYKRAAEIPEVLDSIYCYCKCRENPRFRHKNLLTCFTDDHASECGICMSQMKMAWKMAKEGKSVNDIRFAEDNYFGRRS